MTAKPIEHAGVAGLGAIGRPIAQHIARGGYRVWGFDPDPHATESIGKTIQPVESALELARTCDLVIIAAGTEDAVEDVIFGARGLLAEPTRLKVVAVSSTVEPSAMQRFTRKIQGRDVALLDAPVSRGERAAINGTLSCFAGGPRSAFEYARPVLETFADSIHYLGASGSGQAAKLINNLIFFACISANHEGSKLAEAFGLDPQLLRAALVESNAQNWALSNDALSQPIPSAEKDLSMVREAAESAGVNPAFCHAISDAIVMFKQTGVRAS